jgi:hypothetical protein
VFIEAILLKKNWDHLGLPGRHSPNVSTILLRFFYDYFTIIPCAHFPAFPRKILVSRSKENPSPNLACTKAKQILLQFFHKIAVESLFP